MGTEQILAFDSPALASPAARREASPKPPACPASDFSRDAALLALAARWAGLTRGAYDEAANSGNLVVAHIVRGAIHALAPDDFALYDAP